MLAIDNRGDPAAVTRWSPKDTFGLGSAGAGVLKTSDREVHVLRAVKLTSLAWSAWIILGGLAQAQGCTPQTVATLKARGVPAGVIADMCRTGSGGAPHASVCVTLFGACRFSGPVNAPCKCFGPHGPIPGSSQ